MQKSSLVAKLKKILESFRGKRILVIGDLMWDEYLYGEVHRISPEAPVPVLWVREEKRIPGGACNVVRNLHALKVSAGIIGVVGADREGHALIQELKRWNLAFIEVWESGDRPTILKTRVVARSQQLLRIDREEPKTVPKHIEKKIQEVLEREIGQFDGVIISDYDKGLITPSLIDTLVKLCKKYGILLAVDPQVSHFSYYKGVDLLTPNEKETAGGLHLPRVSTEEEVLKAAQKAFQKLSPRYLLITRAEKGMALFERDGEKNLKGYFIPTVAKEVYDVTGAGDTVVSVFTASLVAKAKPLEAALLSNIAGGIAVGKLGASSVSLEEMKKSIKPALLLYREITL